MWHGFVSQSDRMAHLLFLEITGIVSQASMLVIISLMVITGTLALTWNEVLKARVLQARWDAERARWNEGIRIRR